MTITRSLELNGRTISNDFELKMFLYGFKKYRIIKEMEEQLSAHGYFEHMHPDFYIQFNENRKRIIFPDADELNYLEIDMDLHDVIEAVDFIYDTYCKDDEVEDGWSDI